MADKISAKGLKRLSPAAIASVAALTLSVFFGQQASTRVREVTGDWLFYALVNTAILAGGASFVVIRIRKRPDFLRGFITTLAVFFAFLVMSRAGMTIERAHIAAYGILGYLISRDLYDGADIPISILKPIALAILVGIIDEVLQLFLPYRVFDIKDILMNCAGAAAGAVLYLTR
jgi:hypothetical protein